jgi:hypothetical protein
MASQPISPSLSQGALLAFRDNFYELAQQTRSRIGSSEAVVYLPSKGKTNNMARMGRVELTEVSTRNPNKQYGDYDLDNRQLTKRRFTKTIQIDKLYDINELIADPTSDILRQLINAKERVIDKVLVSAATGAVLTGAPDETPTSTSAADDGVTTITATGGVDYDDIKSVTQNFINNDLSMDEFRGSLICLTGKENTELMSITQFINNDYIAAKPVDESVQTSLGVYKTVFFAGSVSGGTTVSNPILPEGATTRSCVVLAPQSLAVAMEIGDVSVEKSSNKVNSMDITVDFWINAMRTEGVKVQILTTTI